MSHRPVPPRRRAKLMLVGGCLGATAMAAVTLLALRDGQFSGRVVEYAPASVSVERTGRIRHSTVRSLWDFRESEFEYSLDFAQPTPFRFRSVKSWGAIPEPLRIYALEDHEEEIHSTWYFAVWGHKLLPAVTSLAGVFLAVTAFGGLRYLRRGSFPSWMAMDRTARSDVRELAFLVPLGAWLLVGVTARFSIPAGVYLLGLVVLCAWATRLSWRVHDGGRAIGLLFNGALVALTLHCGLVYLGMERIG